MIEFKSVHTPAAIAGQLKARLAEPPSGRVQVLVGPRQVGKTTLLLGMLDQVPNAVYRAVDAPEAAMPGWWEATWRYVLQRAGNGKAVVFLDEIHYLDGWERLVKAKVDELRRTRASVHLVLSGSSSLLVGQGLKETMAGRFEKLRISHWGASDLVSAFGIGSDEAVELLVRQGSYPGAVPLRDELLRWRDYLRDSIMEPAIGRDILMLEPVRKPALLRQVFYLCLEYPARIMALQKLAGEMQDKGALETIAHYLQVLEAAFLVAGIPKFSARPLKRRSSPPKLVVMNNAFLAALRDVEPGSRGWGGRVENACLAHAVNCGQEVFYWREEPHEVDGVFSGTWGKWAVEVKTGDFLMRDLAGLLEFCRRHPDFQPLVLCSRGRAGEGIPGIRTMYWGDFLLGGAPSDPRSAWPCGKRSSRA
ncbi:MAG: ATP-binding protein [Elusimicrobia bacterium]|nr:ATP-binding protein [Elusimicrobiota bacterium]